ncbi:MAG: RnfABCDGE type electron transport complex subunit D [Ruminococcaceae bacterium]|nr:RnfABCDGE type electron transport complex subunit D [Oscillospiraceae bacterium]
MTNKENMLHVASSPHIKHVDTTTSIMFDVIVALVPALIWAVYSYGFRALTLTLISVASCIVFEYLYQKLLKKPLTVRDLSAVVTGILIAFNLPVSVPLWVPVMGSFFAIIVVKQLFGGIGKNIVNPALAARVFLFTAWPSKLSGFMHPFEDKLSAFSVSCGDITASATPLASLKTGVSPDNVTLFDMFMGNTSGCIGEVSAILVIIGGVYLLIRRVITWHIPVSFIGTVALITYLFPQVESVQPYEFMLAELLSGGLMIGAIFMATDYATSPVTSAGRLIYGVGCGLITVFIRYFGGYSEGVSFAILIMNLLVWYIDMFTKPRVFGKIKAKKTKEAV